MSLRAGLAAGLMLLLSACAITPAPDAPGDWVARRDALSALNTWTVKGRFELAGATRAQGSLRWKQDRQEFDVRVSGPFGFGGARVLGSPAEVEIRTAEETIITQDPERVLRERAGIVLPVAGLRYWMLGVPMPGPVSELAFTDTGQIVRIEQAGWVISYEDYRVVHEQVLPHRLVASQGGHAVTIEIREWRDLS